MNILWRDYDKTPKEGDIKILKNGDKFIRGRLIVMERGQKCYSSTGGRPNYVWFPLGKSDKYIEPFGLDALRKEYLLKGESIFSAQSGTKVKKTKQVTLDMKIEADRHRYMQYFNCTTIDSNIDKITLSIRE